MSHKQRELEDWLQWITYRKPPTSRDPQTVPVITPKCVSLNISETVRDTGYQWASTVNHTL